MATKSITITEDAYNRLAALKQENESFSEVIKRIVPRRSLLELAGILTEKEGEELKSIIKESRKRMRRRVKL